MKSTVTNPYVGLRPFDTEESLLFFGRNTQTTDLLQRLHDHHFVAVVGSSGSGKSSLLRAGLIPALKAGYLVDDSDYWHIAIMKPGQNPIYNLAESILNQSLPNADNKTISNLVDIIEEEGADALLDIINTIQQKNNSNFFLLIDQFEELFRFSMDQKEASKKDEAIDFVNIILELAEQRSTPIYIVTTMRSDFIGDCALFYGLPEAMNKSQYLVPRLNRQQLKMVIEGPAKLFGSKVNSSLTSKLLNEMGKVKDELPLLQHVLMRIWDAEIESDNDNVLDLKDYKNVGGISMALSNHADEALVDMNDDDLIVTKEVFKALTAIDENGRKIRRPVLMSELKALSGASEETLLSIINLFIKDKRSFLVVNNTRDKDDKVIDISHESLIRQWSTLSLWVEEEAEAASYYLQLSEATRLNKLEKKDLLAGIELQLALEWKKKFKPEKIWANRYKEGFDESMAYLDKSEEAWIQLKNKDAKRKREKRLTMAVLGLLLTIVIGAGFATKYIITKNNELKSRDDAFALHFTALELEKENPTVALRLIEEALKTYNFRSFSSAAESMYKKHSFYKVINNDEPNSGIAVFSPHGKSVLAGSLDSIARIYDLNGKIITEFVGHSGEITSVAFNNDGSKVLTGSTDRTAKLWTKDGQILQTFVGHKDEVLAVTISQDDEKILTGSGDSTAIAWTTDGNKILELKGHAGAVLSVDFSNDVNMIVTGSQDSYIRIWDKEATMIQKIGHSEEIWAVKFSPIGNKVLAASEDATTGLYSIEGDTLNKFTLHSDAVTSAVFSADGSKVLTGSRDGSAHLSTIGGTLIQKFIGHPDEVISVDFSPDGKQILTGGSGEGIDDLYGNFRLWDIKNQLIEFNGHENIVEEAVFSPDGKTVLTGSTDGTAKLWNLDGQILQEFKENDGDVRSVAFSPDGNFVLTNGYENATLWDLHGNIIQKFWGHTQDILCLAFSPLGTNIITGSFDGSIRLWDLDGNTLKLIEGNSTSNVSGNFGGIWYLDYSPDGTKILAGCEDGITRLFDLDFNLIQEFEGHTDGIHCAKFSPDGTMILSGSEDYTARLYSINGDILHLYSDQEDQVLGVDFAPDSKSIIIGADDGIISFWDLEGNKLNEKVSGGDFINSIDYSPDGKSIIVTLSNNTATLWDTSPAVPFEEFLKNGAIEPLSAKQKEYYGIEKH